MLQCNLCFIQVNISIAERFLIHSEVPDVLIFSISKKWSEVI